MSEEFKKLLEQMASSPQNIRFADLQKVCAHFFGEPRRSVTSHCVFKTPWPGDPRVNIQNDNGKAKTYQVRQVLAAIRSYRNRIMDANKYSYRILWSEEDKEFVGLCAEFPSLSWLAGDQGEALRGITELVKDCIADMELNGEAIPEPISLQRYSGRFVVRTTPELHRQLALLAREAGVSLNRYVNSVLAGAE